MITKVAPRGGRVRGLVGYLFGPGRFDEHHDQRIVGAWDESWVGVRQPNSAGQALLAAELDSPRRLLRPDTERHVYHVVVSNPAGDRELTDDQWALVTATIADELGFSESEGRPGARWIAVHHGASSGGNDHIHFVASLVREDGTLARVSNDFATLGRVRRQFEDQFGLTRTAANREGMPDLSRAEVQRQRTDHAEPARRRLHRAVRGAAEGASTEAEFVALLSERGVIVRPRWAAGGRNRVTGYTVALPTTEPGQQLQEFGGGRLAADLSLPQLRRRWGDPTPEALTAWREVDPAGSSPAQAPRPQVRRAEPAEVLAAARAIAAARQELAGADYPPALAAQRAAGMLAAAAEHAQGQLRRDLTRAGWDLSRLAQPARQSASRRQTVQPALALACRLMLTSTVMRDAHAGAAAVTLIRVMADMAAAVAAAQRSRHASAIAQSAAVHARAMLALEHTPAATSAAITARRSHER